MTPSKLDIHTQALCQEHNIKRSDLLGPSKARRLVGPRRELLYRLAVIEGISTSVTGRMVGRRDHSTVIYNVQLRAEAHGWPPRTALSVLRQAEAMRRAA